VAEPHLRDAQPRDLDSILAITNHAILHSDAIWAITPMTRDQRAAWLSDRQNAGLPVMVAVDAEDTVLGFASYGPFRPYEGYARTVEHSVYVAETARKRGVGRLLLNAMIDHATQAGMHVLIGGVTADNTASIRLHEAAGFRASGVLPQLGRKFDRWLDLVFLYRLLDTKPTEPTP